MFSLKEAGSVQTAAEQCTAGWQILILAFCSENSSD